MNTLLELTEIEDDQLYVGPFGLTLKREFGLTPNGNQLSGQWVLRTHGVWIDYDQYRNDVAERCCLFLRTAWSR